MTSPAIKLITDSNQADGGRLLRELTSFDRAHLVVEARFGRDEPTSRGNSADGDAGPLSILGGPTFYDAGVKLRSPAGGEEGSWIDSRVGPNLGQRFMVALAFNPLSLSGDKWLVTSGYSTTDACLLLYMGGASLITYVPVNDGAAARNCGYVTLGNGNAWGMVVIRFDGSLSTPVGEMSYFSGGALVGSSDFAFTAGDTIWHRPDSLAIGGFHGRVPFPGYPASEAKYLETLIWGQQAAYPTDAQVLAMYQERRAFYADLGVAM